MSERRPREVFVTGVRDLPKAWRDAMASGAYAHESTFLALPFILVALGASGVVVYLAIDGSAYDLTTTRQGMMVACALGMFLLARAWDAVRAFGSNGVFITELGVVVRRGGRARVIPRECIGSLSTGSSSTTRSHYENIQTGETQLGRPIANAHAYQQVAHTTTTHTLELTTRHGARLVVILRRPKAGFYARVHAVRDAWPPELTFAPAVPAHPVPHRPLLGPWVRFFFLGAVALLVAVPSARFVQPIQHRVAFDREAEKALCRYRRASSSCLTDTAVKGVGSFEADALEGFLQHWAPVFPNDPSIAAARARLTQHLDAEIKDRWEYWSRSPTDCKTSASEHPQIIGKAERRDRFAGTHLYEGLGATKDVCDHVKRHPVPR